MVEIIKNVTILSNLLKFRLKTAVMGTCEVIQIYKEMCSMYHDEIFEKALRDVKEESYNALKDEIFSLENKIERFLKNVLECTTFKSERDFNISPV